MNIVDVTLPAVRSDLQLVETGQQRYPWALLDAALQTRIGLDPIAKVIVDALQQPRAALEVLGYAHSVGEDRLDPGLLRRHIRHLARHSMLEGARAEHHRGIDEPDEALADEALIELPLEFTDGLQHACQACGSCCSATDVGPIPKQVADEILDRDWRDEIDGLESNADLFRSGQLGDEEILLTQMRNDQCIFLAQDKLCLIHRHLGMEKKPTPCRQFPFVFARTGNTLAVSLQMECRAYWKAKQAATPPAEHEADLRELLRTGAPVHVVPARVQLDPGFHVARDRYLDLERGIITAVRQAAPADGIYAPLNAFARAVTAGLADVYETVDNEERAFVGMDAWRSAFPGQFGDDPDPWENFFAHLERFQEEALGFADKAAEVAAQRNLTWLSQRFKVLSRSIRAACGGTEPTSFRFADPQASHSVMQDVMISPLFAKEAVRRGSTVRFGLALIGLRALVTLGGACDRAKEACRVEVHTQDLIDSMVTTSKMLREKSVVDVMSGLESTLVSLFLTNLEVFGHAAKPTLSSPGGIR